MKTLVILEKNKVHFYKVDKNCAIDNERVKQLGFDGCSWVCGKDIDVFKHKGILL